MQSFGTNCRMTPLLSMLSAVFRMAVYKGAPRAVPRDWSIAVGVMMRRWRSIGPICTECSGPVPVTFLPLM